MEPRPAGTLVDGGAAGSLGGGTYPITPIDHGAETGAPPKAYLNYIVFNRNMTTVINSGYRRVSISAREYCQDGPHERLYFDPITITEPGFVYVYLSNENATAVEVYFDDFKVEQVKSPVIQSNDYFPFGLTFNSYSCENNVPQSYLYNGKELISDLGVNQYDFGFRQYDPTMGRWWVVDPLAEKRYWLSPYNFVQNNPINRFDPDGLTDYILNKKTGAVTEVVYDDKEKQKANTEAATDRIVKTNRHGEIKTNKSGDARTAIGDVEKGILKDGQNFKTENNIIAVGGEGQPSEKGVESFALKLSNYVGKQIKGAYFGGESTTHMTIGMYKFNDHKKSVASGHQLGLSQGLNLTGFFHTHPGDGHDISNSDRLVPSDQDLDSRDAALLHNPALKFFLLTAPENYGDEYPKKIPYTTGYSRRLR